MDRLSALADEILLHILSFLPSTAHRAQTAAISKRFLRLWLSIPRLDFHLDIAAFPGPDAFFTEVTRQLRLRPLCSLHRLRLVYRLDDSAPLANFLQSWIHACSVYELALRLYGPSPSSPTCLSPSLLLWSRSLLTSLKLTYCVFPKLTNFPGFPRLKTLLLDFVQFSEGDANLLISKCPLLETLKIHWCDQIGRIEIYSEQNPRIKNLWLAIGGNERIVVDAPRLRDFYYIRNLEKLELRHASALVAANVEILRHEMCFPREKWMGLVFALSNAEILSVSSWFFLYPFFEETVKASQVKGPIFKNLKGFQCLWDVPGLSRDYRRAVVFFLRACPMLEELYIDADPFPCKDELPVEFKEDEELQHLLEDDDCLLSRLTKVSISSMTISDEEIEFLEIILQKATALKTFHLTLLSWHDEIEIEQLSRRICSIPSASPELKIDIQKGNGFSRMQISYKRLWDF